MFREKKNSNFFFFAKLDDLKDNVEKWKKLRDNVLIRMERGWIEWPVDPVNESEEKISRKEWRFRSGNESRWPRTSAVPLQSGNPAQSDSLALPARLKNRARGYQISSSLPSSVLSLGWTFARIYPVASSNDHLSNDSPLTPSFLSIFKIKIERRIELDMCCNRNLKKLRKIREKNLSCTLLNLLLINYY